MAGGAPMSQPPPSLFIFFHLTSRYESNSPRLSFEPLHKMHFAFLALVSSAAANSASNGYRRDRSGAPRECCACPAPPAGAASLGASGPVVAPLNIVSQSLFDRELSGNALHISCFAVANAPPRSSPPPSTARPDDARLSFFDNSHCSGDKRTDIYGPHSIGGGAQKCWRDIEVVCDVEKGAVLPTGAIEFYASTSANSQCATQIGSDIRFRDGQCLPSSGGSSAMSASCKQLDESDISRSAPENGRVHVMATFANDDCDAAAPTARVLYDFAQNDCQAGPAGVFFKFVCHDDGSSTFQQYSGAGCATPIYAKTAARDECQPDSEAPDSWPLGWSIAARCGAVRQ